MHAEVCRGCVTLTIGLCEDTCILRYSLLCSTCMHCLQMSPQQKMQKLLRSNLHVAASETLLATVHHLPTMQLHLCPPQPHCHCRSLPQVIMPPNHHLHPCQRRLHSPADLLKIAVLWLPFHHHNHSGLQARPTEPQMQSLPQFSPLQSRALSPSPFPAQQATI